MSKSHMTTPKIAPALLRVMGDQEWTVKELADKIGYSEAGISEVLRKMDAHISAWHKHQQTLAPRWRLGKGPHVPRPVSVYARKCAVRAKHTEAYLSAPHVTGERIWGI